MNYDASSKIYMKSLPHFRFACLFFTFFSQNLKPLWFFAGCDWRFDFRNRNQSENFGKLVLFGFWNNSSKAEILNSKQLMHESELKWAESMKMLSRPTRTGCTTASSDSLLWSERKTYFKKMVVDFLRMDADSPATQDSNFFYTIKTICRADRDFNLKFESKNYSRATIPREFVMIWVRVLITQAWPGSQTTWI